MKLIAYDVSGTIHIGRLLDGYVEPLAERDEFWSAPQKFQQHVVKDRLPLTAVKQRSPLRSDAKIVCIGLNYRTHAIETGSPIPTKPVVFSRWADTVICDGDASPAVDDQYDWEAELGVVIGAPLFRCSKETAMAGVLGYCSFNDLSARSFQLETSQWTLGKNTDRSGPMGPIVTVDEAGDPADGWPVRAMVNSEIVQDGTTADLIFDVPTLLAQVTRGMTLRPGDLMITGTPSGVGISRKPSRYLKPGDIVRVEVGALGAVTTPIVAA